MIIISPGPGSPEDAGICLDVIKNFGTRLPILGVCLGHQVIAKAFGGAVIQAQQVMHGKTSPIYHDQKTIFSNIPSPFLATRYHSLIVDRHRLPHQLMISAYTEEGIIMGIRHVRYPIEGVQFHPESILSEYGKTLIANFINTYVSSK